MSQTGYTPISLYYSSTASAVPTAGNLVAGELAINTADGRLYYKDNAGVVQVIAGKGGAGVAGGSNTQVQYNSSGSLAGSANMTFDGTTLTSAGLSDSGNLTFTGTGNRIRGDFSNATFANRVYVQTSTSGGNTVFGLLPDAANATPITTFEACLSSDPANTNTTQVQVTTTDSRINAGLRGAASALPLTMYTSNTERLRIDTSGNVGIGTSSPSSKLNVYDATSSILTVSGDTAANIIAYRASTDAATSSLALRKARGTIASPSAIASGDNLGTVFFQAFGGTNNRNVASITGVADTYTSDSDIAASLRFATSPSGSASATERMRIGSNGKVVINTTDTTSFSGILLARSSVIADEVISAWNNTTTGDAVFVKFYTDAGAGRGSISYNRAGGLTVYNTTSDYRAKDIYGSIVNSGEVIDSVPVYMGKMKEATQARPMFIAHETPDYAHTGEKDAVDKDGNPVYQQMDASSLVPVLWAEVQSLRKRLAILESK